MGNASQTAAIEYEEETVFGEDVTTFATHRPPVINEVDVTGLQQARQASNRVTQQLQGGTAHMLGIMGGSIKTRLWLHGHGGATSGATTIDAIETFIKYAFGNAVVSASAGTTFTGGTAAVPTTTASATFAAGSLCRAGSYGDARGDGQFAAIHDHTTTSLTLLTALGAAPSNGDVLHSAVNFYLPEDPTAAAATITGIRMRVLSANLRYELHGCHPTAVTIAGTGPGEFPYIEITWGVAWWRHTQASGAFPSTVTSNQYNSAPNARGSFFLNVVGTATRNNMRTIRNFSVDVKLGVETVRGLAGGNQYQVIVGARRTPSDITVKWTEDADAATDTPVLDGYFLGSSKYHALITESCAPGSALAFRFNNLCISDARPVQMRDSNLNRISITARAYTGPTATSDLTQAAMVMAFA